MRYIYHISDIHLKKENDVNLKNSFNVLVNDIVRSPGILVIAGDIFENKTKFVQYEIETFQYFMEILKMYNIYTIIIPGNHDYNINSDNLNNIVDILSKYYSNVHCISNTSIHTVDCDPYSKKTLERSIDFCIFSPIDKQIPAFEENGNFKIAILHETINGAVFDTGVRTTGQKFSAADFYQYDYVLLGDIHKPQFLAPNIAYCGSFVQKNKGEGINHGYILWDLENTSGRPGRHVFIPLKEVFLKITSYDNETKIPELNLNEQKVTYLSLEHKGCSSEYVEKIKKDIEKFAPINKICDKNILSLDKTEAIIAAAKSDESQSTIIREILADEPAEVIERVINRHETEMQNARKVVRTHYQLNYMVWNNMLCYREGNYIDFRTFNNKIVLIDGKNKSGKSSIIDILLFLLFNENSRGNKEDIWNIYSKKCAAKLSFSVGVDEYIIEQCKSGKNCFHYLSKNGINITQDTIPATYEYMSNVIGIGTYKDFKQITTALQNRLFFVDLGKNQLFEFF